MIPENTVIRTNQRDAYIDYDNAPMFHLKTKKRGGIDIRNNSTGLDVADWELQLERTTNVFMLEKDDRLVRTLGRPAYGRAVSSLDFAFDEEMRFYWGYAYLDSVPVVPEKRLEFNWYHPEQEQTVKMILSGVHTIKLVLDDRRAGQVDDNDVCLIYVRNDDNVVCVRYQRDLFAIEHSLFLLRTGESLVRVGTNVNNQLQFEIGKLQRPLTWVKLLNYDGDEVYNNKGHPIWVLENDMNEAYSTRPSISDLTYLRNVDGNEQFLVVHDNKEKQLSLNSLMGYLSQSYTFTSYYTKIEANELFSYAADTYTQSEMHELFEPAGLSYTRAETDSRYALKETGYTKTDADVKFAARDMVYSRPQADETFATKADTYSQNYIDNNFISKGELILPDLNLDAYMTRSQLASTYAKQTDVYTPAHIDSNFVSITRLVNEHYTKQEVDDKLKIRQAVVLPYRDNLLLNGSLEFDDLSNWNDAFTLNKSLSPADAFGSAVYTGPSRRIELKQAIPILVNQKYKFVYEYRYVNKMTPGVDLKIALKCHDRDGKAITGFHTGFDVISRTRLLNPLKVGDTTMRVETTEGWLALAQGNPFTGCIMFFNYKDKGGYVYNDISIPYTRNVAVGDYIPFKPDANSPADAHIQKSTGVITLSKPFDYPNPNREDGVFPVGTIIARHVPLPGPDEYQIGGGQAVGLQVNSPSATTIKRTTPFETKYNMTGSYETKMFPPGTAYVVPVLYPNHNYMRDKSEYGLDASVAPDANEFDTVAISQLYMCLDNK